VATISQILAAHVARCRYEDLPDEAIDAARWFLLDTLGVAWAGTDAPGVGPLREMVVEDGGTAESTIWGTETKVPAAAAALVNGTFAGALDYDGVYEKGSVHPDIVTLPAVFAVGERQGANGKDLLTALVLGNDIACRCGGAMRGNPGWFNTSVHGVFGAAAACARLLGADEQGISNAIGLALSHASGTQQALAEKSLVKRVQSGIAARGAVFSAMAAIRGISAPQAAFEGKSGFYSLYGEGDADFVIEGLGERYLNLDTVTKKFPSCTANHVAIEGAIQLATAEDFEPAVISAIEVELSPFMYQLVGADFDPGDNPQVAAQFSVQYSVACGLLKRRLGIAEIQEASIFDETITALARKVRVRVRDDWPGKFAPCELHIHRPGREILRLKVDHTPGTRENPLSLNDLKAKFRDCAGSGATPMSEEECEAMIDRVMTAEELPAVSTLLPAL